jgi:hypothetical protein
MTALFVAGDEGMKEEKLCEGLAAARSPDVYDLFLMPGGFGDGG